MVAKVPGAGPPALVTRISRIPQIRLNRFNQLCNLFGTGSCLRHTRGHLHRFALQSLLQARVAWAWSLEQMATLQPSAASCSAHPRPSPRGGCGYQCDFILNLQIHGVSPLLSSADKSVTLISKYAWNLPKFQVRQIPCKDFRGRRTVKRRLQEI